MFADRVKMAIDRSIGQMISVECKGQLVCSSSCAGDVDSAGGFLYNEKTRDAVSSQCLALLEFTYDLFNYFISY